MGAEEPRGPLHQQRNRQCAQCDADGKLTYVKVKFVGDTGAYASVGMKVLERVRDDVEDIGKIEQIPKMEGRQMVMVIAPK